MRNDFKQLFEAIHKRMANHQTRILVAVAGPPASGKTSFAQGLADYINTIGKSAIHIPMDGFHRDNDWLIEREMIKRKGSPESFDLEGFLDLVKQLKSNQTIAFPTFDRHQDKVIPKGGLVAGDCEYLILEGNYLLLDKQGWRDLKAFWDISIWLEVNRSLIEKRLYQRWDEHGLSDRDALIKVNENDLPNADLILQFRLPADLIIKNE